MTRLALLGFAWLATALPAAAQPQPKAGSAFEGLELWVGSWLLRPSLTAGIFSGYSYDFEPSRKRPRDVQVQSGPSFGLTVQPSLIAERRTGIHDTSLRWQGDVRFGTGDHDDNNVFDANAALTHRYEIQRDLVMTLNASYLRSTATPILLNSLLFDPNLPSNGEGQPGGEDRPIDGSSRLTGTAQFPFEQIYTNRVTASAAVTKTFNRLFTTVGGTFTSTTAADRPDAFRQLSVTADGQSYDVYSRVGYKISPLLYGFLEPSASLSHYDASGDASGQRIVAGLGSERFSLFRGEVFAGYQRQEFEVSNRLLPGSNHAPTGGGTFGGRISWDPTRDILITAGLSRSLGVSRTAVGNVGNAQQNFASTVTSSSLTAAYAVNRKLTLGAILGYSLVEGGGPGRDYNLWYAGANLNYFLTDNLALNVVYQYVDQEAAPATTPVVNRLTVGAGVTF
jgi:hypothetical protein